MLYKKIIFIKNFLINFKKIKNSIKKVISKGKILKSWEKNPKIY